MVSVETAVSELMSSNMILIEFLVITMSYTFNFTFRALGPKPATSETLSPNILNPNTLPKIVLVII